MRSIKVSFLRLLAMALKTTMNILIKVGFMLTFKKLGRYGRFGNMLFQIAGTIGIAMKNNHSFAFPKLVNWDHLERFGSKEPIDLTNYFENPLPEMPDINFQDLFVHWGYHDITISPDRAISLEGHMQSPKYFNHCIDIV